MFASLNHRYMLQAWARIGSCLGQDFERYMGLVIPDLLRAAAQPAGHVITTKRELDEACCNTCARGPAFISQEFISQESPIARWCYCSFVMAIGTREMIPLFARCCAHR